jgi:hypothetical protein
MEPNLFIAHLKLGEMLLAAGQPSAAAAPKARDRVARRWHPPCGRSIWRGRERI